MVEVWHKFEGEKYIKVVDLQGVPTLQHIGDPNNNVESPYLILAHYRSATQVDTKTLYHDGFRIAESADDLIEGDLYDLTK